jgi:hypothetical protein
LENCLLRAFIIAAILADDHDRVLGGLGIDTGDFEFLATDDDLFVKIIGGSCRSTYSAFRNSEPLGHLASLFILVDEQKIDEFRRLGIIPAIPQLV